MLGGVLQSELGETFVEDAGDGVFGRVEDLEDAWDDLAGLFQVEILGETRLLAEVSTA